MKQEQSLVKFIAIVIVCSMAAGVGFVWWTARAADRQAARLPTIITVTPRSR